MPTERAATRGAKPALVTPVSPVRKVSAATLKRRAAMSAAAASAAAPIAAVIEDAAADSDVELLVDQTSVPQIETKMETQSISQPAAPVQSTSTGTALTTECMDQLSAMLDKKISVSVRALRDELGSQLKHISTRVQNTLGPDMGSPGSSDDEGEDAGRSVESSPISKVPKLGKLATWDGTVSTWGEWLYDARMACRNAGVRRTDQFRAIAGYISGAAKTKLTRTQVQLQTLDELSTWVGKELCSEAEHAKAYQKLPHLTWMGSVAATEREFRKWLAFLPQSEVDGRYTLTCFKRALPTRLAMKVQEDLPTTFDRAVRVAIQEEGSLVDLFGEDAEWTKEIIGKPGKSAGRQHVPALAAISADHGDEYVHEEDVQFAAIGAQPVTRRLPFSRAKGTSGTTSRICKLCNQDGHFLRDCPEASKPENATKVAELKAIIRAFVQARQAMENYGAQQ